MRITEPRQIRSTTRTPAKHMMRNHVPHLLLIPDREKNAIAGIVRNGLAHLRLHDQRVAVQDPDRDEKENRVVHEADLDATENLVVHEADLDAKENRVVHDLAPIVLEVQDRVVLARVVQDHDQGAKAKFTCKGEFIIF